MSSSKPSSAVRKVVKAIPLLRSPSGPRDGEGWTERLKEEYSALIAYVEIGKRTGNEWFEINATDADGIEWTGKCWFIHEFNRYEFKVDFEIPIGYPQSPMEIRLIELDGMTKKMYRGGRICTDGHMAKLWAKNAPRFGIAHALAMGLAPWLASEVPILVDKGLIQPAKLQAVS